jgi:hypothetical protein
VQQPCPEDLACGDAGLCQRVGQPCRGDADCPGAAACHLELLIAGASDTDGDEVADPFDNCPDAANVSQADTNLDGIGDACDATQPMQTGTVLPTSTRTPSQPVPSATPTASSTDTPATSPTVTPMASPTATQRSTRTATPTATATATRPVRATSTPSHCVGDCGGDGAVTVNEIIVGVNVALGGQTIESCPLFDCNGNGQLTVDCLIRAVNASLDGCS